MVAGTTRTNRRPHDTKPVTRDGVLQCCNAPYGRFGVAPWARLREIPDQGRNLPAATDMYTGGYYETLATQNSRPVSFTHLELPFFEDRDLWIRASEISSTRELTVSLVRIYERADSMRHQPIDIKDKINTRLVVARRTIERNLDAQGPWWKPAFPTMAAAWLSAGIQCIQDGYKYRAFVCLIKSFTTHPNCHAVRFMLRAVIPNGIIATIKKYAQRAKERDALLASAKRDTTRKPS